MSKETVIDLANQISINQADTNMLPRYYDEEIFVLGATHYLIDAAVLPVVADIATFVFPVEGLSLLEVIWDGRCLDYMTSAQLRQTNPHWVDERGTPLAYTTEDLSARSFMLYPKPPVNSDAMIFEFGSPLGLDFPSYSVTVIFTKFVLDVPEQLELPILYKILSREFKRESRHMDLVWSKACEQLSQMLLSYLPLTSIV